jgi:hypothetical protein
LVRRVREITSYWFNVQKRANFKQLVCATCRFPQLFDLRAVCRGNNELFLVPWNKYLRYSHGKDHWPSCWYIYCTTDTIETIWVTWKRDVVVVIVWWLAYNYLCNQCLTLWFRITLNAKCTLWDKVCHRLAAGRWLSPGTPVCSTNKPDRNDITEKVFQVELNTITLTLKHDDRLIWVSQHKGILCIYTPLVSDWHLHDGCY